VERRYIALAVLLMLSAGCAGRSEPDPGEVLYVRFCASCHGVTGRGDGPAAEALSPRPADLTRLRYSMRLLIRQIDGRQPIRAHGSAKMPVWGEVFAKSLVGEGDARLAARQCVQAIARHVHDLGAGGR
jgi:mono/diheme cytochrome c family protein